MKKKKFWVNLKRKVQKASVFNTYVFAALLGQDIGKLSVKPQMP